MRPTQASDDFWYARPRIPDCEQITAEDWCCMWDDNWHIWCGCPL